MERVFIAFRALMFMTGFVLLSAWVALSFCAFDVELSAWFLLWATSAAKAALMWTTHLVGLVRMHAAASPEPQAIVTGVNRGLGRWSP